ncbi:H(+)/Cl(-) exchange transporter ClcA [Rosistilla oblonga]|uniref:H(+)/Cl(-) exchange transporter ClcA n=1 Tax=Rosistilla oblonga TaxID=2527990 RepID=A0A518IWY8_9BACT|nr:chloride channel protein [Rosistilla oblonga]QDV14214.1 H(+)/Cl(-) exchange transporter ClcA [Rosistilla oblonga]QDV57598.1 H(+)/Cl(-) exchange transporter ClcA [Rosistilla oblonga]
MPAPPHLAQTLRSRTKHFRSSSRSLFLAVLVGVTVGLGAVVFQFLGHLVVRFSLVQYAGYAPPEATGEGTPFTHPPTTLVPWMIVVVMVCGALVAGWMVYQFAPEAAGPGTDAAIDAFHNQHGKIAARVPFVKTIASAIALGTGTSGGREGPICQIGAGIGSMVAQRLQLSPRDRRILLAAGMGAGVGALFRAPLAGAVFAAEILYSDAELEADVIVPAATSSVIAYSIYTQSLPPEVRFQPLFGIKVEHAISGPLELIPYLMLACALIPVGIAYVQMFYGSQWAFERLPVRPHVRPAIGALFAGIVGVGFYYLAGQQMSALAVLGSGSGTLQEAVHHSLRLGPPLLIAIALVKIVTTSLSIGSGSPGGVFGPSMVIGGCFSAGLGLYLHDWMPNLAPHPEAFAIVGMAGFFAGVSNAPISTIIMVRALTGDFGLLVPTMLVTTITFGFGRRSRLYRKQVPTRMDSPAHRGDFIVDVLDGVQVRGTYRPIDSYSLIHESMSLDEIVHRLADNHQHYFPVVDADRNMVGIFTDDDVRSYLFHDAIWKLANASDVMTTNVVSVTPDDDLNTALGHFTALNLEELPVVEDHQSQRLLGMLRRRETIATYNRRIREHKEGTRE